jgi:drug/metabolite transporter (DMT)-like permease
MVGAALEWRTNPPELTPAGMLGVLYIGVFAAFLAVVLWNEGVRRTGPSGAMAFYNMLPVFGALLGAVFLGERLAPLQVTGAVLVVVGGLISALWRNSASRQPAPSTSQG